MPQTWHTETASWLDQMNPSLVLEKVDLGAHDLDIQMLGTATWHYETRPRHYPVPMASASGLTMVARDDPPLWD